MKDSVLRDARQEAPRDIYTVTEITEAIKQHLESEFPRVSVVGEIANFKLHTSGHRFFTLRDGTAMLHAVLFRRYAEALSREVGDGMLVIASGRLSHFGGSGQTQIIATDLIPAGRGKMELEYRRLLQRLMDEGLTAPERKRPIPSYPRRIAVITSPTGAVLHDILDTLRRRWPVAEVVHVGAEVQGPEAAGSIVRAFEVVDAMPDVDVVILARGGGSVEDLWTFNLEAVARAVAGSAHPVITGVGHEIDTTVVDYVSDLRAATPTAAAERATPLIDDVKRSLAGTLRKLSLVWGASFESALHLREYLVRSAAFPAIAHRMERAELEVDDRLERLARSWTEARVELERTVEACRTEAERLFHARFARAERSLEGMLERVARRSPAETIRFSAASVEHRTRLLEARTSAGLSLRRKDLAGRARALAGLDPRGVLKRGYAYCTTPDEARVIPRAEGLSEGDGLAVHFYDGGALCEVREKRKGKQWRRG